MISDKRINPAEKKTTEQLTEECNELLENLRLALNGNSLSAPKIFSELVQTAISGNLDPQICNEGARILANYTKEASIFKRRMIAEKFSNIDIASTVLFLRHCMESFVAGISLDTCLTKCSYRGQTHEGFYIFRKPDLKCPMALGNNTFGQLGIGSEKELIERFTPCVIEKRGYEGDFQIRKLYVGSHHTIFVMDSGDYFACGKAANFLEGEMKLDKIITTPVRLDYVEQNRNSPSDVILTATTTRFINYQPQADLLIGSFQLEGGGFTRVGKNFAIVSQESRAEQKNREKFHRQVNILNTKGNEVQIVIQTDALWHLVTSGYLNLRPIIFIVGGKNIEPDLLWKNFHVCGAGENEGVIYAVHNRTLYKGTLVLAPECQEGNSEPMDDSSENRTDEEGENEVLIAMMEEVALPMSIEKFAASEDGTSLIIFPLGQILDSPSSYLHHFMFRGSRPSYRLPALDESKQGLTGYDPASLKAKLTAVLTRFDTVHKPWKEKLFEADGLAVDGVPFLHVFMTLRRFLLLNKGIGIPEMIDRVWNDYEDASLAGELREHSAHHSKVQPLVIETEFWSGLGSGERECELRQKSVAFIDNHLGEIFLSLEKMMRLPLKYHKRGLNNQFGYYISHLIDHLENAFKQLRTATGVILRKPRTAFMLNLVESAVENRLEMGDISKNEKQFELIRVEAVAVHEPTHSGAVEHTPFSIKTTRFFIQAINPSLMESVSNGVLNLNLACLFDSSDDRFRRLLDAFFHVKDDEETLQREFVYFGEVEKITRNLAEKDLYTITAIESGYYLDEDEEEDQDRKKFRRERDVEYGTVKVPKDLFRLFSNGYDAGRRRTAEAKGENPDCFSLDFRVEAVEATMEVLFDVRSFYALTMQMKKEVYLMCSFCMFSAVIPDILRMIVMTAQEEDSKFIRMLFFHHQDLMVELVGKLRPDIILFWKQFPIHGNYLEILEKICEIIRVDCYDKFSKAAAEQVLLFIAHPDKRVDTERVDKEWLSSRLYDEEKDKDIKWAFTRTLFKWDGWSEQHEKRPRRRRREENEAAQGVRAQRRRVDSPIDVERL